MAEQKKNKTLKQQAYEEIQRAIYSNVLLPGEPLTEENLAARLQISRTPIRAALQQLEYDKLATRDATGHYFVSHIGDKDIRDMTMIRLALEPLAIENAELPVSAEYIQQLRDIYDTQLKITSVKKIDLYEYALSDCHFHMKLAELSDNNILKETMRTIQSTMMRYNILSGTFGTHTSPSLEEHKAIIDHLENNEKQEAIDSLVHHIQNVSDRIFD